jgi:hypothetical protein
LKLLQEKVGKTLEDIGICNYFLNGPPNAQEIRARVDTWDCIILKISAHQKQQIPESRDNLQNWRKSSPAIQQIKH